MNTKRCLITLGLIMIPSLAIGATATDQTGWSGPPPAQFYLMSMSGIAADDAYLYIMADGKIMKYEIGDLDLSLTTDLPEPTPPSQQPPKRMDSGRFPPPPPRVPGHGLWLKGEVLYVLAGPVVHLYKTSDLTLQNTLELPKPEPPTTGN